ncbi:MAG: peptidoglycan DD-metalloendopeptidase family protein [Treponemataceae bacterium]
MKKKLKFCSILNEDFVKTFAQSKKYFSSQIIFTHLKAFSGQIGSFCTSCAGKLKKNIRLGRVLFDFEFVRTAEKKLKILSGQIGSFCTSCAGKLKKNIRLSRVLFDFKFVRTAEKKLKILSGQIGSFCTSCAGRLKKNIQLGRVLFDFEFVRMAEKKLKTFSINRVKVFALLLSIFIISSGVIVTAILLQEKEIDPLEDINFAGQGGFDSSIARQIPEETIIPNLYYSVYRVKAGDMIGNLAEQFNITQDCLISTNNIKSTRSIQIGQYLRIPSMTGILYTTKTSSETPITIAEKYDISAEKVAFVNKIALTDTFPMGQTLFLPDAELDWVTRQEINGDLFIRPIRNRYHITSNFGWRSNPFTGSRTYHNGIDLACPQGTTVYAALSGRVVAAGWDNVFGNYVIIAHHSGYRTLYGHMSRISIGYGANVGTGTKIGEVGNTGMSTGSHLHFTIFKNGKPLNPRVLWN